MEIVYKLWGDGTAKKEWEEAAKQTRSHITRENQV